jgi:transcriptional regulator with XRE-family HTH domain
VPTDLAPVTPSVLKWARESIGASLDPAVQRAAVSVERVAAWESGEAEPTVAKLRALAKLYQRPLAVFFLPQLPLDFDALRDFRKLPRSGGPHVESSSPQGLPGERSSSRRSLPSCRRRRASASSSRCRQRPSTTIPMRSPSPPVRRSASASGNSSRGASPTTPSTAGSRRSRASGASYFGRVTSRPRKCAASHSAAGPVPVIVVNALDWPRGQVFTLLHEFAHLMLREGGLSNLLEPDTGITRRVEMFCNAVAGAIIMPAASFLGNEVLAPPGIS